MDISLYVCTHKKVDIPILPDSKSYIMLQCGQNSTPDLGYLRANTKENIGHLNRYYYDLIGHYWIWKNTKSDVVGLLHYHRFLYYNGHIITADEIENLFTRYDVLLPTRTRNRRSFYDYWVVDKGRPSEIFDVLRDIIGEYNSEITPYYDKLLHYKEGYSLKNILICKRPLFDGYCEFVFTVLESLRNKLDLSKYKENGYIIGALLNEFLINVWFAYKNSSICYLELRMFAYDAFDVK